MEWRLLDALFLAVRNFANSNLAKDKATVDVLWVCFIHSHAVSVRSSMEAWRMNTYRRGLLRCSFWQDGQCEGLESRNE